MNDDMNPAKRWLAEDRGIGVRLGAWISGQREPGDDWLTVTVSARPLPPGRAKRVFGDPFSGAPDVDR